MMPRIVRTWKGAKTYSFIVILADEDSALKDRDYRQSWRVIFGWIYFLRGQRQKTVFWILF